MNYGTLYIRFIVIPSASDENVSGYIVFGNILFRRIGLTKVFTFVGVKIG